MDRLDQIVDGAGGIALEDLLFLAVGSGEEDDRDTGDVLLPAHQSSQFIAAHLRHVHIEEGQGEFPVETGAERVIAALGPDDVGVDPGENALQGKEIFFAVIDDQYGGLVHRSVPWRRG